MNEQLSIETPEQIELNYDIAGIGSRSCAALIDSIVIAAIVSVGWALIGTLITFDTFDGTLSNWLVAIVGIITFALFWGYYIAFDLIANGQSPGKRLLKLRVIKDGGYPISFTDSAVRNLVRGVDFLPVFYGVGMISMVLDKKWRRLGDFAAGTLVVRERTDLAPTQLTASVIAKLSFTYADHIQIHQVSNEEMSTIREYISRRKRLSTSRRQQLARTIGRSIAERMGVPTPVDYNLFLEEIFALIHREENR